MSKEDPMGGAAFPTHGCADGMSLRDYFAGQALIGIMADPFVHNLTGETNRFNWIPKVAYAYADAMLYQRNLKKRE